MTQNQPVTRVVDILTNAGYRQRTSTITVASVPFEFAALLLGSDRANDLIIVIDTLVDGEARIRQKVEGLSRALDLVGFPSSAHCGARRTSAPSYDYRGPRPRESRAHRWHANRRQCRSLSCRHASGPSSARLA